MFRRSFIFGGVTAAAALAAACTNNALDPAKIVELLKDKNVCGIIVPLATIVAIINAMAGATAQVIVSLICSSYQNALAAKQGETLKASEAVHFVVHVCDDKGICKDIPVDATKAQ